MLELKLVTIDNFYSLWRAGINVGTFFDDLIQMRVDGFGAPYPENHLPLSSLDFVVRHTLFCVVEQGKLLPVSGFYGTDWSHLEKYHLRLPIVDLANAVTNTQHSIALQKAIAPYMNDKKSIYYSGGFTLLKKWRANKELSQTCKELVAALMYRDHIRFNTKTMIAVGVPRFKTDAFITKMGFNPLTFEGKVLEPLPKITAEGEPISIFDCHKMSDWAKACFEKHAQLIANEAVLSVPIEVESELLTQTEKRVA